MPWYELSTADDPKLNELAEKYHLHPLHIEDARSADESIKVEQTDSYTFAVLKPVHLEPGPGGIDTANFATLDIFAGRQGDETFFITIADPNCSATREALARAHREGADEKPARLLYLILDTIVDLYFPAIDLYDDRIDELEDRVVADPEPAVLQEVFAL